MVTDRLGVMCGTALASLVLLGIGETTWAATSSYTPTDDVYIQGTTKYDNNDLRVQYSGPTRTIYIRFSIQDLPAGANIVSATLSMTEGNDTGNGTFRFWRGSHAGWTEASITAGNAPVTDGQVGLYSGNIVNNQTIDVDVSSLVTGNADYTVIVTQDSGGNDVSFASRATANGPVLEVIYAVAGTSLTWKGTPDDDWDIETTANWNDGSGSAQYSNGDDVTFDDSADGSGAVSVDVTTTVNPGSATVNNPTRDYTFTGSGKISGSAGLSKQGAGKLSIATDNDHSGITTHGGGTIQVGAGAAAGSLGSGNVQFTANAVLAFNRTGSTIVNNRLYGSGAGTAPILQINSGTVSLGGATDNAWASATVANGATLEMNKSGGSARVVGNTSVSYALTVSAGGTARFTGSGGDQIFNNAHVDIAGTLDMNGLSETVNNINLQSGSTVAFPFGASTPSTTTAPLAAGGNLTVASAVSINVTGTGLPAGTYPLISFGSGPADASAFSLSLPAGKTGSLAINAGKLELTMDAATQLKWASGSANWTATDVWVDQTDAAETFSDGDSVEFEDTKSGSSPITVTLNSTVSPDGTTFDNSTKAFTITGTGKISGSAGLSKQGTGKVTLATANDYAGTTTVDGGTLEVTGEIDSGTSGNVLVANAGASEATLNIKGDVTANKIQLGNNGAAAVHHSDSAAVVLSAAGGGDPAPLGGLSSSSGFGYYGISAGTFNAKEIAVGDLGTGLMDILGGTVTPADNVDVAVGSGTGVLTVNGGAINAPANGPNIGHTGRGEMNVTSGSVNWGGKTTSVGLGGSSIGIVNLLGGTTTVDHVTAGGGSSTMNFNGGTLAANQDAYTTGNYFVTGLDNLYTYPGGAIIKPNGYTVYIYNQLIAAPPGNGVNAITVGSGGSGYIAPPYVQINGGGGSGATAIAQINAGAVSGITVTCPGVNYTTAPAVSLVGGGGSGAAATATITANSSGRLIIDGAGKLQSNQAHTYAGGVTINQGSFSIGNDLRLGPVPTSTISDAIILTNGGTVLSSATALTIDSKRGIELKVGGGALENNGAAKSLTYNGVIAGSGPLEAKGLGTITLGGVNTYNGDTTVSAGTLALGASGSLASPNITVAAGATFDVSAVSGGFSLGSGQTLGGNGTVAGAVTVAGGGTVAPGNSVGTLTVGDTVIFQSGSTLEIEVTGSGADLLTVTSATSDPGLNVSGATLALNVTGVTGAQSPITLAECDGTLSQPFAGVTGLPQGWRITYTTGSGAVLLEVDPTLVVLTDFDVGVVDGQVVVSWATASELNTVGFFVERLVDGQWVPLNSSIIPATGWPQGGIGATYEYVDTTAVPGMRYTYQLIEVETGGGQQVYGPFERLADQELKLRSLVVVTPEGFALRWLSREGDVYRVLRSEDLHLGGWDPVATNLPATPPENTWVDEESGAAGYYRVEVE